MRTCHHLYAVGVRVLYEHVELRSFNEVTAFFHLDHPVVLSAHADPKRVEWECIKSLEITIAPGDSQRTLGKLPASLSGPGVGPLQLDRLRLTYKDDADFLIPLLRCLDPVELGVCVRHNHLGWHDACWLSLAGWNRVRSITTVCSPVNTTAFSIQTDLDRIPFGPPFPHVTSAVIRLPILHSGRILALVFQADFLVQLCPALPGIEIHIESESDGSDVQSWVTDGVLGKRLGGKPSSFFSIVLKLAGSNIWGDIEGRDGRQ